MGRIEFSCRNSMFWPARGVTQEKSDASVRIASWSGRKILAPIPKNARHPDKLVQEFFYATAVSRVGDFAALIKKLSCIAEVDIPKNRDQAELTQHREQTLDHPCTAERTSRYATNANGFVNVFLQVCVEHMF